MGSNNNERKIISLMEELKIKDEKIAELNEYKDIIPVIFQSMDQKIHYAIICKITDRFNIIENILYDKFPEYEESENYFTIKGKKVMKSKTLAQNNIGYSDIILLNKIEV